MDGKSRKSEGIKEEIIIKSREVVAKMGYRKASTEEIARSLNRTKGTLYHYFESRDDILKAVVRYEGDQLKRAIFEALDRESDPPGKLFAFFLTRSRRIFDLWSYYRSVIVEYFARYSFVMTSLSDYNSEELSLVQGIIQEGIEKNIFFSGDASLSARALIKAMKGYDFFMFQGEHFEEIEDEMAESLRTFIRGLKTRE